MTWVKINGKNYYMVEFSSSEAIFLTEKEFSEAQARGNKFRLEYIKKLDFDPR